MDSPKDKKRVLPSLPAPVPATPLGKGPSADDVVSFLRQHPDFLNEHPDLLGVLTPPKLDRGERVVDMQHFMVQHQRNEIARIKAQNKTLVAATRANLMGQARVHTAALAIIGAQSFEQLIQVVITDLAGLIDADVVTIAVERQGNARAKMPHHGIEILEPGTVAEVLGPERDVVFQTDIPQGDPRLFGAGAGLVRSGALVRLPVGRSAPAGMLCVGTRRTTKFNTGHQTTELLSFLARTLGVTIATWLDLPR
ncbi:MAG TPA: DUF484 family protein [Stellaceae bacterium]|jgi:hypothetical protein|nr:DUF484 family protein [Stellaceae bacterium]